MSIGGKFARLLREQGRPFVSPKGDSIVSNELGTYAFGLMESAQAMFFVRVEAGAELPERYLAAIEPGSESRHRSVCGKFDLVCGIIRGCADWCMPDKTEEELEISRHNWEGLQKRKVEFQKRRLK